MTNRQDKYFQDCQCINFVLDGKTYTAIEDPQDGYRSSLDKIIVSDHKVENVFTPVEVVVSHIKDKGNKYNTNNCWILRFTDTTNGKVVLEVGTDDTDDYYPTFVSDWMPASLSINGELK